MDKHANHSHRSSLSGHRHHGHHKHHRRDRSFSGKRGLIGAAILLSALFVVVFVFGVLEKLGSPGGAQSASGEASNAAGAGGGSSSRLWASVDLVDFSGELYGIDGRTESFLFVGTDDSEYRHEDTDEYVGPLGDFILLMVLDYTNHSFGYVQIDRNTITNVYQLGLDGLSHGEREQQICTAHMYGKDLTQSAENIVLSVSELLGYLENINGYFVMNMDEMEELNASVGGVTVTIPDDMTSVDPAFVKGETIKLSGDQAEKFVRARMTVGGGTNAERMSRQRLYMDSFFKTVTDKSEAKADFYLDIYEMLRKIGTTNMNGNSFSRIANMLLTGENKGMQQIEGETKIGTVYQDGLEHEEFYPFEESIKIVLERLLPLVPVETQVEGEETEEDYDLVYVVEDGAFYDENGEAYYEDGYNDERDNAFRGDS